MLQQACLTWPPPHAARQVATAVAFFLLRRKSKLKAESGKAKSGKEAIGQAVSNPMFDHGIADGNNPKPKLKAKSGKAKSGKEATGQAMSNPMFDNADGDSDDSDDDDVKPTKVTPVWMKVKKGRIVDT